MRVEMKFCFVFYVVQRTTNSPLQVIKLAFVGERASWRGWISNVGEFRCALLGEWCKVVAYAILLNEKTTELL